MTIKLSPYDTFIGSSHAAVVGRFVDQVTELDINTGFLGKNAQQFMALPDAFNEEGMIIPTVISSVLSSESNIMPAAFATLVNIPAVGKDKPVQYLVSDARAFIRGRSAEDAKIINERDFEFLRVRTILTALWMSKGSQPIKAISRLLPACYAFWIGDKIASRFMLDAGEKMKIRAIAYLFHHCQYTNAEYFQEQDRRLQAAVAAKVLIAEPKIVTDIFTRIEMIGSVDEFIQVIKDELQNPRLNDLNAGTLATQMAATWYQSDKLQAVAAVEHPPTFAAMIYCAFSQRGYRDTPTFKSMERFKGGKGEQEITRAVSMICGSTI